MTDYRPLSYTDAKIQVDSAIRDGNGVRIDTNYQKKPQVVEYTVPTTVSPGNKVIAEYDGTYDGTPGYVKFVMEVTSSSSKGIYVIEATWGQAKGGITLLSSNGVISDAYYACLYYPSSTSNYAYPPLLAVYNYSTYDKQVKITILESSGNLTWKTDWNTAVSTTGRTFVNVNFGYSSEVNRAASASNASSSIHTYQTRNKTFRVGEADLYKLMAIDHTGVAYKINTSTKKFPLPISMYFGIGSGTGETSYNYQITSSYSTASLSVLGLTSSSYNGFTMPTLTADDGGKTLYVRGSLDADGYFVCDGNVTLSMEAGYTYIPFGSLAPNYNGTTAQVPTQFSLNVISVPAYTLDANGKLTHVDGQEVGGGGTYTLNDVSVTFALQTTPDYAEFPYCAEVTAPGVTPNSYASVTYSNDQAQSLMYSPTAVTGTGVVKLYARQDVGTVTIPSIAIGIEVPELDGAQPISSPIETRTLTLVSSSDTEYPGFPYKYSFACVGATATRTAEVTFDVADATSGNFVPICETGAGVLYIWAKAEQATARIGYMLYYVDTLTDLSGLVTTDTAQVITGRKTIYSANTAELPIQTEITSAGDIGGIGYYDGNGGMIIKTWGTTTGKYTIELLDGSQKSAQVINQRSYNASNTNDIVTIGTMRDYACKGRGTGEWKGTVTSGVYGAILRTYLSKDTVLLQFSLTIDSALGSITDSWYLPYTPWESALGISIDKSAYCEGTWTLYQNYSPYGVRIDRMGYGATFDLQSNGIRIGRFYNTSGSWGNWNLQSLEGLFEGTIVVRLA